MIKLHEDLGEVFGRAFHIEDLDIRWDNTHALTYPKLATVTCASVLAHILLNKKLSPKQVGDLGKLLILHYLVLNR